MMNISSTYHPIATPMTFLPVVAERPHFEMLFKTPSQVLIGDDISGSVRAL